ncbi:MAG: ribosome recycling factor [Rhodospirillaceae bacterium]
MADFSITGLKSDIGRRMDGAIEVLHRELGGLRNGRASASLLEPLTVAAYGAGMPMNQVGTIGVPEPRMLTVQVWDKSLVSAVEKAIRESNLGLNPATDGQLVRVPIPALTEERRTELTKVASGYAEDARVAVRNVRKHAMDSLKNAQKSGDISEDEYHEYADDVQKLTDGHVKSIDDIVAAKESEIMQL